MTIVFVGSNPSEASPTCVPFLCGTKSRTTLTSWIVRAGICTDSRKLLFCNIADYFTPNNRALSKSEIISSIPRIKSALSKYTHIVALGKTAHKALELAGIPHLELSHPSGLNRKLNCPLFVNKQISKLRDYTNEE
jgi:uracil-DNA glycosylase